MEQTSTTFTEFVQPQLERVEERMRAVVVQVDEHLAVALDHLLSAGGKRVRPTLVILAGSLLDADESLSITHAAAIEMLHTATLVHDDLIDNAMIRRGTPTLNAQWSPNATVLTGDYVFARAALLAAQTGSIEIVSSFARTLMTIVNGEIRQLFRTLGDDPFEDYRYRIYAKTASLFELATEGPALLIDGDEALVQHMKRIGYHLGMAFQIVDDVLDFVGDQSQVGKPVASDLRNGLITLPTLYYFEDNSSSKEWLHQISNGGLDQQRLERLIESIQNSDAIVRSLEDADRHAESGIEALMSLPERPERAALFELANFLTKRSV